jgi:CubicO group peptidase (beta-lactamase class C family)
VYSFEGKTVSLDDFFERTVTTAFLVLKDDSIVLERYFRDATPTTPMTSWSVAKSVVSILVGVARDEGKLGGLSTPLATHAPDLAGKDYGKVTLRDALTMSSGITFSEVYADPSSDIHTMFARIFYLQESIAHYLGTRDAEASPGARFQYSSADTLALGLALRGAVKQPLAAYLEEKLWRPLGMEHDATWNAESEGDMELAFCCLNATARDYAKIGRLMARGGDWDGKRIVSEAWVREATQASGALSMGSWGYGYQWWLPGQPGVFMAAGVWGQFIYVDPARQVVVVKTSVDPDFEAHSDETVAVFEMLARSL